MGIEIERKFEGSRESYSRLTRTLTDKEAFAVRAQTLIARDYAYYDTGEMDLAGSRLAVRVRRVTASGEWGRYDMKWQTDRGETQEVEIRTINEMTLNEALEQLREKLDEVGSEDTKQVRKLLSADLHVSLEMHGLHHKSRASKNDLEMEISLDEMEVIGSGKKFCELEVELKKGEVPEFDRVVAGVAHRLGLEEIRDSGSKYIRGLGMAAPVAKA